MRNLTSIAFLVLASACVTRAPDSHSAALSWRSDAAAAGFAPAPAPAELTAAPAATAPVPGLIGKDGYTKFSLGIFEPTGDISGLDSGYYAQVAFGGDVIPLISVEASIGYGFAEGPGNSDLALVPLLVSGRVQIPIALLKLYGGVGVGGAYIDYTTGPISDDEFLLAATAFLGAEVGLGNLAIGVEYRYLTTDETDRNFTVEGNCGLVTLTLPF
jgi:opacity protein-like surface antigen